MNLDATPNRPRENSPSADPSDPPVAVPAPLTEEEIERIVPMTGSGFGAGSGSGAFAEIPPHSQIWVTPGILALGAALMFVPGMWTGLALSVLEIERWELFAILSYYSSLGILLIVGPFWWFRAPSWSLGLTKNVWRKPSIHVIGYLALFWPLPLGALITLSVALVLWNRLPFPRAVQSQTTVLRWSYLMVLLVAVSPLFFPSLSAPPTQNPPLIPSRENLDTPDSPPVIHPDLPLRDIPETHP